VLCSCPVSSPPAPPFSTHPYPHPDLGQKKRLEETVLVMFRNVTKLYIRSTWERGFAKYWLVPKHKYASRAGKNEETRPQEALGLVRRTKEAYRITQPPFFFLGRRTALTASSKTSFRFS
jgi:hypothetical protein